MESKTDDIKSFYREKFNGPLYLKTYFGQSVGWWETHFLQNFKRFFENEKLHGGRVIEIGCGPTIHLSASASLYCETLLFADISKNCREFLENWRTSGSYETLFEPSLRYVAQLENQSYAESDTKIIHDRIRDKLKGVLTCDVLSPAPFGDQDVGLFDVIISCGCLEGAALSKEQFGQALKNVITVLKPGGTLILAGYHGGTYYYVGNEKLPSLELSIEDVEESLKKANLIVKECQEIKAGANDELIASDCARTFVSISTKPE